MRGRTQFRQGTCSRLSPHPDHPANPRPGCAHPACHRAGAAPRIGDSDMIAQMRESSPRSSRRPRRRTSRAASPPRSMPAAMSSSSITDLPTTPRDARSHRTRCSTSGRCESPSRRRWWRWARSAANCGWTMPAEISARAHRRLYPPRHHRPARHAHVRHAAADRPSALAERVFLARAVHRMFNAWEPRPAKPPAGNASTAMPVTCCFSSCLSAATARQSQRCSNGVSSRRSA